LEYKGINNPLIIAEAGVSHFGNLSKALSLVDLAADSGADCIKFQHYKTDDLYSDNMQEWKNRMRSKEVEDEFIFKIFDYSKQRNIPFILTPHTESALPIIEKINPPFIKIGSGELGNFDFLDKVKLLNKEIVVSTGMHSKKDIEKLVNYFHNYSPGFALLHCTTSYPTSPPSRNLKAIKTLIDEFPDVTIGYSDHTESSISCILALALGAKIIEKHISLDFNIENAQDWRVSCGPADFPKFIQDIRECSVSLGTGELLIQKDEVESIKWAIKRLSIKNDLKKGDSLKKINIKSIRSDKGIPISEMDNYIEKKINKNLKGGEILSYSDFN